VFISIYFAPEAIDKITSIVEILHLSIKSKVGSSLPLIPHDAGKQSFTQNFFKSTCAFNSNLRGLIRISRHHYFSFNVGATWAKLFLQSQIPEHQRVELRNQTWTQPLKEKTIPQNSILLDFNAIWGNKFHTRPITVLNLSMWYLIFYKFSLCFWHKC